MKSSVFFYGGIFLLASLVCRAEDKDFRIFGRITSVENKTYDGYMTWGKSKMFWTDFFEASKLNNPYSSYFEQDGNITFVNRGEESYRPPVHSFVCRFGNLKTLEPTGNSKARLEIKNGYSLEVSRGTFQDVGSPVTLLTLSGENIILRWDKISRIEFLADTVCRDSSYHLPIAGIIKTTHGIYKGLITWDRDEKTLDGLLDGRTSQGEKSIRFNRIRKIAKGNNDCRVTLDNGTTVEMWGSNDVNNQNRGILVNMPNVGEVSIPWSHFESFEALPLQNIQTLSYGDFQVPVRLQGELVTRKGKSWNGIFAYDLDETWDFEVLDGKNDNVSYRIPFKYVKTVEPKNYKYSFVTLRNGSALSLGDTADVDETNSGILIFSPGKVPAYISWKETGKIIFN